MATLDQSKLGTWFPSAQHPIIISAPMLATANGNLAAEVSKAGGIGNYRPPSLVSGRQPDKFS